MAITGSDASNMALDAEQSGQIAEAVTLYQAAAVIYAEEGSQENAEWAVMSAEFAVEFPMEVSTNG
jgi:hypothetical protein